MPTQNASYDPMTHGVPLEGSGRAPAPDLTTHGPADPSHEIEVVVILRRQAPLPDPSSGAHLTAEELSSNYGASDADMQLATGTFERLGAKVLESDPGSRRIRLGGTVSQLSHIFGTELDDVESAGPDGELTRHRHRSGELRIPAELDGIVVAVLGLDDRPQTRAHFRMMPHAAANTSYSPPDLGKIYSFPAGTDGSGQTVAIIELGGGFSKKDLKAYFAELGMPAPTVKAIGVDGAANHAGKDPQGADGEVLLDIEVVGALAPKATIDVYFAPNTDAGFLDAIVAATKASPVAISISWGQSEDAWTAQARNAMDQAFADAAALGITTTAAAGDSGSGDGVNDGKAHVDFPASSPHALGCGGTRLEADPATGVITAETVWNDGPGSATGGGYSDVFPVPSWQAVTPTPSGRGVPDVGGVADPQTGYKVRVDGTDMVIGGTSAVAPLWAALIARLAQATGKRFGLIQPALYGAQAGFQDITVGNNGSYSAGPGWDPCTGLGSPNGTALLAQLTAGK
ncbi:MULTISPECIES: S53 family peptidase [Arthrobacter]|uniref:S53 family peptidase n=2 Tax=Arthrobacter TaxID=1663 RepID=A0ABU9KI48_9MICC|nr:S53 family peptidase [Arthrobacter sp. YJM1]MDP5225599.1 S53 family peptidase [Arthrobacter sp. YJM1]